jgi:hypothetical protein
MATDPEIDKYPPNPNPGKVGPPPPQPVPTVEKPDDDEELFEQLKRLKRTSYIDMGAE